jgi:hypothetical protein
MWWIFKDFYSFLKHLQRETEALSSNVRHFERFLGFLKTFSEKV